MNTERGFLTAAYKNIIYAEQAVTLVLSARSKGLQLPFALVTDDICYQYLRKKNYLTLFDEVIQGPDQQLYQFIGKLHSAIRTPFEDTIYFDSDCLIVRHADRIFETFSQHDFCVPGADMTSGVYYHMDIKDWLHKIELSYIPIFNAGVFRFNEIGKKMIYDALIFMQTPEKYLIPRADGGLNEQIALGIAMSKAGLHPIPYLDDYHFSFFNANSPLELDLHKGICKFLKEGVERNPWIFHYTPLYHASFYFSQSRKMLDREIYILRKEFHLPEPPTLKPNIRVFLSLLKQGKVLRDPR